MALVNGNLSGPATLDFYGNVLKTLLEARVPFLVGGGYAIQAYIGMVRVTKDFDVFLKARDVERALQSLSEAGFYTELTYEHWLGKAYCGADFVDIIFNSGNGCCPVDERWFEHATEAEIMGLPLKICPPEEAIWQKAFIMERERYDGADVAHLLRVCGAALDWRRLLERFGPNWRVLLSHLTLFGYVYPDEQPLIPKWLMRELLNRLRTEASRPEPEQTSRVCRGTLLSRQQYDADVQEWGYHDARLPPVGEMTPEQIESFRPPEE